MQKEGNTSPYLLSTIIDLDKDEGLKNKDVSKLENAIQVSPPLAELHWLNRIYLFYHPISYILTLNNNIFSVLALQLPCK